MTADLSQFLMRSVVTLGSAVLANRPPRRQEPQATQLAVQPPAMPTLPTLPQLPTLPGYAGPVQSAPAQVPALAYLMAVPPAQTAPVMPTPAPSPDIANSYAAEMDDPAVACLPCTRGHLSAVSEAAAQAAAALQRGAEWEAREQLARVAGEIRVMQAYDWQAEKLERADPRHRQVLEATIPEVQPLLEATPQAPEHLVLAWAAVDESLRFARSAQPSAQDRQEIRARLVDAERNLNYVEREGLSPTNVPPEQRDTARDALQLIRVARHKLTTQGSELAALEDASVLLNTAVVALTPAPDPAQVQQVAQQAQDLHRQFYRRVFSLPAESTETEQGEQSKTPA